MRILRKTTVGIGRILLVGSILLSTLGVAAATVSATNSGCYDGEQTSGAKYRICMPPEGEWDGDLVVYAHGYVAFDEPIAIPEDQLQLPDGTSITDMITGLGFAFATSSYSTNGLAVKEGVRDLLDLVDIFSTEEEAPSHVYLIGVSEGGLIAALGTEQHANVFDGGVAACGPVGDFGRQLNYWGDARVLFDYFFPDVLPAWVPDQDPLIPQDVIDNWDDYEAGIRAALYADPDTTRQLLRVARVPVKWGDNEANVEALVQLMWYSAFATDDGVSKVGGQPYDNVSRWYWGSKNDWQLNREVVRFDADQAALDEIEANYQTSGALSVPLVTLHTLQDPVAPYSHEPIYRQKVRAKGTQALHINVPSLRYGHCSFGTGEALFALALLIYQVRGFELSNVADVLTLEQYVDYVNTAASYEMGPAVNDSVLPLTIERDLEPVIASGDQIPDLQGTPTDQLFVYAYRDEGLQQIPFQVDEVVDGTYAATEGNPLGEDDEIAFMASDLGGRPSDESIVATLPISPTFYRIEVKAPPTDHKGWAYVVRSSSLTKTFTQTYTTYDASHNRIVTPHYALGFASSFPGLDYLALNESGIDILDRTKIRITVPILGTIDEDEIVDYVDFEPITAMKEGPVRVLASGGIVGYRSMLQMTTAQSLPAFISPRRARFSTDFNHDAEGSMFYDANTSEGVPIDGEPDTIAETPLSPWFEISGATGTLVQVSDSSGLGGTQTNYYKDDATKDPEDTGDERSYGDTGIAVESPGQTIEYRTTIYVLPSEQDNLGETFADYFDHPLRVEASVLFRYRVYLPLVIRN